ncbi:MAG: tetratricopeptide repeat protein [Chloroflexota bacterium]
MSFDEQINEAFQAFDTGNFDSAEAQYQALLETLAPEDADKRNSVLHMLGFVYAQQGKYAEARASYLGLLDIATENTAKHIIYHQLGMVERMAGEDYAQALVYLVEESALLTETMLAQRSANHYEIGHVMMLMGDTDMATQQFQEARDLAQSAKDAVCLACAYRGLGDVAKQAGDVDSAKTHYKASKVQFMQAGDTIGASEIDTRLEGLTDG